MSAILGLLSSLSRNQQTILENHGIPDPWQTRLDELLAWDFQNSRSLRAVPDGFELEGFAARDFSTGAALHCPCQVRYEIAEVGDRRHLIRREIHTHSQNLDHTTSELVCFDVDRIICGPPGVADKPAQVLNSPHGISDGLIPARVAITVVSAADGSVLFFSNLTIR